MTKPEIIEILREAEPLIGHRPACPDHPGSRLSRYGGPRARQRWQGRSCNCGFESIHGRVLAAIREAEAEKQGEQ